MSEVVSLIVPSRSSYLYIIRSAAYPAALEAGFSKRDARMIVLGLDEACSNIIKYAYQGDPSQVISVKFIVEHHRITLQVVDTGKKPDVSQIGPRSLEDIRPGGLGTHIINSIFDRVEYDTSPLQGTILTLEKVRKAS